MTTRFTRSAAAAVLIICFITLNHLFTQWMMAHRHHRVSALGLIIWTAVYLTVGVGLAMKNKIAFWGGLIISLVQIAPIIICTLTPLRETLNPTPPWYLVSMTISALLGLALLIVLCLNQTREQFFKRPG
jgi:hypothetical protein